jgi:two-component system sensor histidine kinase YesM
MGKNSLKRKFRDMRLTGKLVVIYLLAGFVPVIIILSITYMEMKKILWDRETTILQSYVRQTTDAMDNELEIYNNLSKYISYNQSIAKILSADQSAYQNYEQFSTVIDPLLSSIMYFHENVNQVTIYTDASDVKHGSTVAPLKDLSDGTHAYDDLDNNIHWRIDMENHTAFSVSRMAMLEQRGAKGVLYVSVDYDSVFQPFYTETMFDNYGLVIEDEYGNTIFAKNTFADDKAAYELNVDQFKALREMENSGYQFIDRTSNATGWNICVYKPDRLIISSVQPILIIAGVAILVSMFAGITCIHIISEFITKRIKKLQKTMKATETGNLGMVIENDSADEIGDLINGYNSMSKRLDETVNEVYQSKIKEKEYEMRALQAQINPHFLYNSLSMINWKALEADQEDISHITLALSTFYRTALNKGKNILLVKDEIANIKSYLDIQLAMHDNSFDVVYDIDDSILKYETLNLILQPLLENAIGHGIDVKTDGRGEIRIEGKENGDFLDFTVSDNGVGMTKTQAALILSKSSNGYGVSNVNERIKLYYGEQYAVKIDSTPGVGTKVMLHFPKRAE